MGPGNAYVAEAKKQGLWPGEYRRMIAGPSEVLVLADGASNASWVAADLLSQAEHDRMASRGAGHGLPRVGRAGGPGAGGPAVPPGAGGTSPGESIERNGKIIVARSLEEGIQVANRIAPEHLELCVDQPFDYLSQIRNAGSVFLGRYDPEPMGTILPDPTIPLPTMGTARFYSPPLSRRLHQKISVQLLYP